MAYHERRKNFIFSHYSISHPQHMSLQNQQANQTNNTNTDGLYIAIIRLLSSCIKKIKNSIGLYIICLLIGTAPVVAYYYSKSNTYEATFTLAYDELVRKIYGDRIDKLNIIIQSGNYNKVATILSVDKKAAQSLTKVEGYNILGEDLSKDLNTDKLPFIVSIKLKDTAFTTVLQNGIVKFLETGNSFMVERKKVKELENKEELSFINEQLSAMSSMLAKGNVSASVSETNQTTAKDSKSAKTSTPIYEYAYELYKRKQELQRKERMPSAITVIDDAIVSKSASKPLWLLLAVGFIGGNFIFLVLAGILIPALRYKG
ncbi:hypothetical protein CAP35_04200 [Chitinophagaceae bacterium IBVUCB1]|nr:hypothetical protein CAP35_04200 [Chitinophagaceae bacterium IBVUCB1]